jgi:hypothetical protein
MTLYCENSFTIVLSVAGVFIQEVDPCPAVAVRMF